MTPTPEPDEPLRAAVAEEQRHLDHMYTRLDDLRTDVLRRQEDARHASDGTPAGRFTRDALAYRYTQEIGALTAAESKLCFGRLDTDDGDSRHIGRLGLTDGTAERRQILIDWRAPAAAPFYTATTLEPAGVIRRRHLQTRRQRVVSVADEYLQGDPDADPSALHDALGSAGDGALLAALNAPRTGRMHDIIATIQAEQDRIIRSDKSGVMVVQGGPGTGKTVVALHRAAYLLYTHRDRLGGHGVLVVGPNATFLDYIGQVLPSLGESSVVLATVGTLYPGVGATAADGPIAAEIKGRRQMATIIDNAVLERQRMPRGGFTFRYDRGRVRVDRALLARAQRRAWASRLPHNRARAVFIRALLDGLAGQVAGRSGVRQSDEAPRADRDAIRRQMADDPDVHAALAPLWPATTPEQLIADLLSDERRLAFAAPRLTERQRRALLRPRTAVWTVGDVPLLDEAAELLGDVGAVDRALARQRDQDVEYAQAALDALDSAAAGQEDSGIGFTVSMLTAEDLADLHADDPLALSTADRAATDRSWTYGHVIVDEAQELSAMAWRMVMRRCPVKSMTVVGDIAQTSDPAGASGWASVLRPHVADRWRLAELTVNYRTPAEIMQVAAGVLARIDPEQSLPTSVRRSGFTPWARRVAAAELDAAVAGAAAEQATEHPEGQLAVLVPSGRGGAVLAAVQREVPDASGDPGPGHRVVVLEVRAAKGLEFDAVLVVEPAEIAEQSSHGLGDLYVAITRATQRLGVLHSRDLPDGLGLER